MKEWLLSVVKSFNQFVWEYITIRTDIDQKLKTEDHSLIFSYQTLYCYGRYNVYSTASSHSPCWWAKRRPCIQQQNIIHCAFDAMSNDGKLLFFSSFAFFIGIISYCVFLWWCCIHIFHLIPIDKCWTRRFHFHLSYNSTWPFSHLVFDTKVRLFHTFNIDHPEA